VEYRGRRLRRGVVGVGVENWGREAQKQRGVYWREVKGRILKVVSIVLQDKEELDMYQNYMFLRQAHALLSESFFAKALHDVLEISEAQKFLTIVVSSMRDDMEIDFAQEVATSFHLILSDFSHGL
jgi:hypothetical protein